VDGVSLVSRGLSQALSIAAAAEPGGILSPPPVAYMHKIAVGPAAKGAVDIVDTPENNLRRIAFAMDVNVQDLTVVMLDRPRHQALLERVRALGARVALISDGDVGAAMMTAWPGSGVDVMIGAGGTQEAIVAACAMRCLGGELHCRPWVRHEEEAVAVRAAGYDPEQPITMEQLVPGRQVSIAVTGISGGGILRGVQYHNWWAETHSLVMRAQSGTVREIRTKHHVALPHEGARRVS
jgi:fructose-1,6-bisphosphatase II